MRTACLVLLAAQAFAQVSLPKEPWLPADNTDATFANLLGNLVYFYDAQRTGELPASNRVPWRNDSCLEDGKEDGVDLSGRTVCTTFQPYILILCVRICRRIL